MRLSENTLNVMACTCPRCGRDLDGLDHDRVFTCNACSLGFDITNDPPLEYPLMYAVPKIEAEEGSSLLYLPVWRFHIEASLDSDNPKQLEVSTKSVPESVLVIAFQMHGLAIFGNLNLLLARALPSFETETLPEHLVGCRRSSMTAQELLKHIVLARIDRAFDVTGLVLNLKVTRALLLGYPFYDHGRSLTDGLLGHTLLGIAFDDISAIRKYRPTE
jgi:hypothetical protein